MIRNKKKKSMCKRNKVEAEMRKWKMAWNEETFYSMNKKILMKGREEKQKKKNK